MADTKISVFCRPLFKKICDWSREIENGGAVTADSARQSLTRMLDEMHTLSKKEPELGRQFMMIELPILFYIDFVMKECMGLTGVWEELAFQRNELAGDEKFFDLLEQALGNPTDLATERVEVYYQCLSLGFTGTYHQDAPELQRLIRRCALRLGLAPELVETGRVTPDAYGNLDIRVRRQPFSVKRWRLAAGICVAGFVVMYFVNEMIFQSVVRESVNKLERMAVFADMNPERIPLQGQDAGSTSLLESTGVQVDSDKQVEKAEKITSAKNTQPASPSSVSAEDSAAAGDLK